MGGVVLLFVVCGYQGTEEDSEKLQLTDKLLQAVLAEAQGVYVGQPLLIAGDLNADPAVIPCLAKGISAGGFVDLALAYFMGAGRKPDATCKFRFDECAGSGRDFIVGCSDALAASTACRVTDRWFTPHFSVFASFCIDNWTAEVSCPVATQPIWPACWIDSPDRSPSSLSRAVLEQTRSLYAPSAPPPPPSLLPRTHTTTTTSSVAILAPVGYNHAGFPRLGWWVVSHFSREEALHCVVHSFLFCAVSGCRSLRGRQIAYLIYECFQVTGANDSVENYAELFCIGLRNDDIQEFDSKWDEILRCRLGLPSWLVFHCSGH